MSELFSVRKKRLYNEHGVPYAVSTRHRQWANISPVPYQRTVLAGMYTD